MSAVKLFVFLCFTSLVSVAFFEKPPFGQSLIVLFVDGFGSGLLNETENDSVGIKLLIENGVRAEYLKPAYPTQNFPSWMSFVSGLYTENHGFTADYMWDENHKMGFYKGEQETDSDELWWYGRPAPVWYTAGKSKVDVHCYWIAGCHLAHGDMIVQVPLARRFNATSTDQTESLPTYFAPIVERIAKYQPYKQQLFLLRYAGLENTLRMYGAQSDEAKQSLARLDMHVQDLQQKLEQMNLFQSTNLIMLSGYGLHPVERDEQYYIEECLSDYSKVTQIVNSHSMVMVFTEPENVDTVFFELKVCEQWSQGGEYEENEASESPLVSVYRTAELPEKFHWKNSRFMPSIILMTRPGAVVLTRELPSIAANEEKSRDLRELGGWDVDDEHMKGIFVARGPAFKANHESDFINMVDVYQIMLNILGIEPSHRHNGSWTNVEDMLSSGWESRSSPDSGDSAPSSARLDVSLVIIFLLPLRSLLG